MYSTDVGRVCPDCRRALSDCMCGSRPADEPLPSRPGKIVAKVRTEKKGRGGKTVTVVSGLPRNATFLAELCKELKRACATGGTVSDETIELQGELRNRVREYLLAKNFVVKG